MGSGRVGGARGDLASGQVLGSCLVGAPSICRSLQSLAWLCAWAILLAGTALSLLGGSAPSFVRCLGDFEALAPGVGRRGRQRVERERAMREGRRGPSSAGARKVRRCPRLDTSWMRAGAGQVMWGARHRPVPAGAWVMGQSSLVARSGHLAAGHRPCGTSWRSLQPSFDLCLPTGRWQCWRWPW